MKNLKRIIYIVTITSVLFIVNDMSSYAIKMSDLMPAGGLSLVLEDGVAIEKIAPVDDIVVIDINTEDEIEAIKKKIEREKAIAAEKEAFSKLVIADVNEFVNIRSESNTDSEIVGKLYDESVGQFIKEENGWIEIESGNAKGYVKAEYVVTGEAAIEMAKEVGIRIATVNTTTLFVREEASKEAAVVGMVPLEDQLVVIEETDEWAKVSVEEGDGYVSKEFVDIETEFVVAESKEEEEARLRSEEEAREEARRAAQEASDRAAQAAQKEAQKIEAANNVAKSSGSDLGNSVATFALQFVGNPYVYGGTSLTNGADCSGFVQSVYKNFGVGLPRTSGSMRGSGYNVGSIANAVPGDIVCYSGHVGLYIGNGNIVHASSAKTGIKISNACYREIICVRRIF